MEEQISQQSSYLPPTPIVPPSPINQNQVAPKKKVGLVVGLVIALVMTVGVGAWGYSQYSGEKGKTPQIAKLTEDRGDGYTVTQTAAEEKEGKGSIMKDGAFVEHVDDIGINISEIVESCKTDDPNDNEFLCVKTGISKKNKDIVSDANKAKFGESCGSPTSTYIGSCANGEGVCTNGICVPNIIGQCLPTDTGCPTQCTAALISGGYKYPTNEPGGGKYCDDQGRECSRYRNEFMTTETIQPGTTKWCFSGYGEQCGEPGQCGPGTNVRSPSPKPSVPASPNPSPSPTMACTGLTQTPTTQPVIGSKLTFTCAGVVTPSNAGTLSYNFRYAINNGSWVNLTNKTTTTAEMTISSCGTYKVECRACATIGGLIKCDPFWQYAGVQPL